MRKGQWIWGRALVGPLALVVALLATVCLSANAPDSRFSMEDGGVKDKVTGLHWQQPADSTTYNWDMGIVHCASFGRLPAVEELYTLVDVRATAPPTIDQNYFTPTAPSQHWAATSYKDRSAWAVDFSNGVVRIYSTLGRYPVRCVRP